MCWLVASLGCERLLCFLGEAVEEQHQVQRVQTDDAHPISSAVYGPANG